MLRKKAYSGCTPSFVDVIGGTTAGTQTPIPCVPEKADPTNKVSSFKFCFKEGFFLFFLFMYFFLLNNLNATTLSYHYIFDNL